MPDLKVTLLQSVLCWENVDQNLEMFSRKIDGIETPTNLILLPETFNTGFTMNPSKFAEYINGKSVSWMKAKAKATNCAIAGRASRLERKSRERIRRKFILIVIRPVDVFGVPKLLFNTRFYRK